MGVSDIRRVRSGRMVFPNDGRYTPCFELIATFLAALRIRETTKGPAYWGIVRVQRLWGLGV